jgi:hypothetical protein
MARYVILSEVALVEAEWQRLGCSEFAAAGYTVLAADLRGALGLPGNAKAASWALTVNSMEELETLLADVSPADTVFVFAELYDRTRPLFRLLGRYAIRYCSVELGTLPLNLLRSRKSALSIADYLALRTQDLISFLYRARVFFRQVGSPRDYAGLGAPWLWLTAGTAVTPITSDLPSAWRAVRKPVASFDSLKAAAIDPSTSEDKPVAVFLDEAFCDHPDFEILDRSSPVTCERYWTALERMFRSIEIRLGLRVIVAPHPKARGVSSDAIRARMCAPGQTPQLVQESSFVLCHASTAVSFAVLFRKPLMFITTDELERSVYRYSIARMSSCFALKRVNAERFNAGDIVVPFVDERRYRAYERLFLRAPDASMRSPWTVMREEFEAARRPKAAA